MIVISLRKQVPDLADKGLEKQFSPIWLVCTLMCNQIKKWFQKKAKILFWSNNEIKHS